MPTDCEFLVSHRFTNKKKKQTTTLTIKSAMRCCTNTLSVRRWSVNSMAFSNYIVIVACLISLLVGNDDNSRVLAYQTTNNDDNQSEHHNNNGSTLYSSSARTSSVHSSGKVQVLVYETQKVGTKKGSPAERLVDQLNQLQVGGITATIFGQNQHFTGYGSKFIAVLPILEQMKKEIQITSTHYIDEPLVVISDSRDVLVNNRYEDTTIDEQRVVDMINEFRMTFDSITYDYPHSIVISAEAQCCVSALTHVPLGGYYSSNGTRDNKACSSGTEGCLWAGDDKAEPWENFMNELMVQRTNGIVMDDAYLNAGLIVGKVSDLVRIFHKAAIADNEDDQALLTDYMYHYPNDIVLDYGQKLFGNTRGGLLTSTTKISGCVFEKNLSLNQHQLVHIQTQTTPLFLHSPGGYFTCYDQMSTDLNIPKVTEVIRKRLRVTDQKVRKLQCNYGRPGVDGTISGCETAPIASTPVATAPVSTPAALPTIFADRFPVSVPTTAPVATTPIATPVDLPPIFADRFPVSVPTTAAAPVATTPVAAPVDLPPTFADRFPASVPTTTDPVAVPVAVPTTATPVVVTSPVETTPIFADRFPNEAAPVVLPVATPTALAPVTTPTAPVSVPTDLSSFLSDRLSSPTSSATPTEAAPVRIPVPTAAPVSVAVPVADPVQVPSGISEPVASPSVSVFDRFGSTSPASVPVATAPVSVPTDLSSMLSERISSPTSTTPTGAPVLTSSNSTNSELIAYLTDGSMNATTNTTTTGSGQKSVTNSDENAFAFLADDATNEQQIDGTKPFS